MESEISRTHAALLLIAVAVIAIVGTAVVLRVGGPAVTGLASIGYANVTVANITDIKLNVSSVDFGNTYTTEMNNTTDEKPPAFVVENNGSTFVDVTIVMNHSLFDNETPSTDPCSGSITNNSCSFQYAADNCSATGGCPDGATTGCFDWANSKNSYTNFTLEAIEVIDSLNFSSSCDEAEVDILIWVPSDEGTGLKSSQVTFTASQAS
jgi:hypothetical protein